MIHHLSIPARDTRHVSEVLAELLGGVVTGFGPYPNSWIAWAGDDHGTAIEVYPVGTEMYPPEGPGQAASVTTPPRPERPPRTPPSRSTAPRPRSSPSPNAKAGGLCVSHADRSTSSSSGSRTPSCSS